MTAALGTAEIVALLLGLFLVIVGVLTLARIVLKREDLSWSRVRIGFFVERDRARPADDDAAKYERGFDRDS